MGYNGSGDIVECLHSGHLGGGWYDMKSGFGARLFGDDSSVLLLYQSSRPPPSLLEIAA